MAKKCSTCKRSYPDHLPACPHCKPAKTKPAADDPFDDPFSLGEHEAPTKRPAPPKAAEEDVVEIAPEEATLEVADVEEVQPTEAEEVVEADDVVEILPEQAETVRGAPSAPDSAVNLEEALDGAAVASDALNVGEAEIVSESPSSTSGVLVVEEPAVGAGPPSGKSDVLRLDEASIVAEPASGKSDVLEIAEAEAVAEPASGKSDVLDISEAEIVAEAPSGKDSHAIVEVVEEAEPEKTSPPPPAKKDLKATRMAGRAPAPTMLANEDLGDEPGSELGGLLGAAAAAARPSPPPPAPPTEAPPAKKDLKATRMAGKAPAPTMLAGDEAFDEAPGSELGGAGVSLGMPNLQLDSGKHAKDDEAIEVADEEVLEAAEASDVRDEVEEVVEDELVATEDVLEPDEVVEEVVEEPLSLEETIAFEPSAGLGDSAKNVSALDLFGEDVLVEGASEVDLGRKPASKGGPSGVDMIAEALESGVDLEEAPDSAPRAVKPRKGPRKSEIDLEGGLDESADSSAVDLGAAEAPAKGKKRTAADEVVEEVIDEAVEVGDEAVDAALDEALLGEDEAAVAVEEVVDNRLLDDDAAAVVEEAIDDDLVVPKAKGKTKTRAKGDDEELFPEEEEDTDRKRGRKGKAEKARGGFGRVLVGMFLGLLLTAGGAGAIWYFAPDLLTHIPESPGMKDAKWQKVTTTAAPKQVKTSLAVTARKDMDNGEFDKALVTLKGGDESDEQVARGEALWRKYLQDQRAKNAALSAEDESIKQALKDFGDAGNKYFPEQIDKAVKADQQARVALATDKAVRDALVKANLLPKAEAKNVGKVVTEVIAQKREADEVLAGVTKALVDTKNLKKDGTVEAARFTKLMKDLTAAREALEAVGEQLKVDAKIDPQEVPKRVLGLEVARKALDDKLTDVNARLKEAGIKATEDKGVQALAAARDALRDQKKALDGVIEQALGQLKQADALPPGDDPKKQLVEGTRAVRLKAESPLASSLGPMFSSLSGLGGGAGKLLQRGFDSTSQSAQLALARAREALLETPEERLDTQIALARGDGRKDPRDVGIASKYLEWVNSKAAKAAPEMKAKAQYALGLAQRNIGQYAAAVQSLKKAVDATAALKTPAAWADAARDSLKDLTDATAYFLPRAKQLEQQGKLPQALEELNTALKALPGEPRLLAERGLVRLGMVQPPAKLDAEAQKLVREDAAAVQKDPRFAAEGYYLLGRLEEQTGHLAKAEQNYTKAVEMNQGTKEDTDRYKSALGNLLLRDRPAGEAEPAPKGKAAAETSRLEDQGTRELAELAVLLLTAVQPPPDEDENPEQTARLKKAVKLAEDLLKSNDPKTKAEGYMILGQVYAKQGKRTDGLFAYVKGLELYYPGKKAEELVKMVNEHPAFQQPDALAKSNPQQAERHFGKGLEYYWARRYPAAEEQFRQAVVNYDQDARYLYFLGLARYAQPTKAKREAAVQAFRDGARLEAANRPHAIQVNASMERVQGEVRQILNGYRQRTP